MSPAHRGSCWRALLAGWLCALAGCSRDFDASYGERAGLHAGSVNGTAVFSSMFEQRGHRVRTARYLAPKFREMDTIVWFPDDFEPPTDEVCDWFEEWLTDAPGRTLIYVGRDYDAAPHYWRDVQQGAPQNEIARLKGEESAAEATFATLRASFLPSAKAECYWFDLDPHAAKRAVRAISGKRRWTDGVAQQSLDIELFSRIEPHWSADVLLESPGDALVWSVDILSSRILVVANGSFLLNYALVNHEHRKLAANLLDEVPDDQDVAFLESGRGGPQIFEDDPAMRQRTGLEILGLPPFDVIFVHLAAAGVIFIMSRLFVFGRPRPWIAPRLGDFGRHVAALGELLMRTRDRRYAEGRVKPYLQGPREE